MPAPYSKDLRERVGRLYRKGTLTYDEVAQLLGVGRASVSRYLRLERESGSVTPKPAKGGASARLGDASREAVSELVAAHPDKTPEELDSLWTGVSPREGGSVRRAIEAAGATLKFLPPSSPDMMPIENAWSKVKHLMRAQKPRDENAIDDAFAHSATQVTPSDAAGWLAHCGYQAQPM